MFRLDEAWRAVDALDYKVSADAQTALYQEIVRALRGQTFWLAQRTGGRNPGVRALIGAYRPDVDVLQEAGAALLSDFERDAAEARMRAFTEAGAPGDLARKVAGLRALTGAIGGVRPGPLAGLAGRGDGAPLQRGGGRASATTACGARLRGSGPPTAMSARRCAAWWWS